MGSSHSTSHFHSHGHGHSHSCSHSRTRSSSNCPSHGSPRFLGHFRRRTSCGNRVLWHSSSRSHRQQSHGGDTSAGSDANAQVTRLSAHYLEAHALRTRAV